MSTVVKHQRYPFLQKYIGKLLTIVIFDADNQIFRERLHHYITKYQRNICIIYDRYAGIKVVVARVFLEPFGVHRYCARHMGSNFNTHFMDHALKSRLFEMAFTALCNFLISSMLN